MIQLREAGVAALGHLEAYVDLIGEVRAEYIARARRSMRVGAVGALLLTAAIAFAAGWALLEIWQQPHRRWIALGVLVLLGGAAWACLARALGRSAPGPQAAQLRAELGKDRQLLRGWAQGDP